MVDGECGCISDNGADPGNEEAQFEGSEKDGLIERLADKVCIAL